MGFHSDIHSATDAKADRGGGLVVRPMHWSSLPDIDDVAPISEKDMTVLAEIREVLLRHDCIDRFGVNLLHSHFDIAEDEVLVEYTDADSRRLVSKVERIADLEGVSKKIATQWTFDRAHPRAVCDTFCRWDHGHTIQHRRR